MATLLKRPRGDGKHDTFLNWDWPPLDPARHTLALNRRGDTALQALVPLQPTPLGWRLAPTGFQLERCVLDGGAADALRVVAFDRQVNQVVATEAVTLEPSFFADLIDRIAWYRQSPYRRPGRLAAFTHVCNEGTMLRQFVRHYARQCDPGGLYVINHGSEPRQIDPVRPLARVLDLPRGETDHINIAAFCGHFQRLLLTQYDWVIHVDCDELLLCTRPGGNLRALLDELPAETVLQPAQAWDLTHDLAAGEPPMDWRQPLSLQRQRLYPNEAFIKPVLANRAVSWSIGFHMCLEPCTSHPELALVHLRDADHDHAVCRDAKWAALPRSPFDQAVVGGFRAGADAVRERLLAQAADPTVQPMPDWMRGMF